MKRILKQLASAFSRKHAIAAVTAVMAIALPISSISAASIELEGSLGVANVTAGDTQYKEAVNASYDDVVKIQVYYHNREAEDSGKVANNLRVNLDFPTQPGKTQVISGTISADDANTVNDTVTVNLDRDDAYLEYIPGSAVWKHNAGTNENVNIVEEVISDQVVYGNQGIVVENAQPCFNFDATITVLARVKVPGVKVNKQVRVKDSGAQWSTRNTAKPGETLEYLISYENAGNTKQENVVVRDNLPPRTKYIAGTTYLANENNPNGVLYESDNIDKGGIVIGNYSPGANAFVKFDVKLPEETELQCGVTEFRNVGIVRPEGMNEFYNTAITRVEKECEENPEEPVYACSLIEAKKLSSKQFQFKVTAVAKNGATIKQYRFNFGDGNTELTDQATVNHTFEKNGTYVVTASVDFMVDGKVVNKTSNACKITITTDKEVETCPIPGKEHLPKNSPDCVEVPDELPSTGTGSMIGVFAAVSLAAGLAHKAVFSRRFM